MDIRRIFFVSFAVTLGVWLWFSWPLPRYVTSGVPASAHLEPAEVQPLIPGDHLQFMYYCWLAGDMVSGKTPLFCNLYEFNTGGEDNSYRPDAYYFPFSLVYALGALAGSRALGWNLTGFISLWLTYLLTWLLIRRYAKPDWLAGCAALIAITLPFRWINLCGGSPAGFAMLWIPAILLGIDLAVREGRIAGGILTGLALLFASWTDNHVFFFGALAVPFWTLVAVEAGMDGHGSRWQVWRKLVIALLPIVFFLGLALAFPTLTRWLAGTSAGGQHLASTVASRSWREVALYSPASDGFFAWFSSGVSNHIYIGFSALVFTAAGGLCLLFVACRNPRDNWRRLLVMVFIAAGIIGIMALALGTQGPGHAILLRILRKLIPPYALIRQPAKIFCLMPSLLAVITGLALSVLYAQLRNRKIIIWLAVLFCAAVTAEYVLRVNPTVSILDKEQGAYKAVAEDAALKGNAPHALVVPLWPGDSHYSSVYQYYASLYRVRMVNGYNPFVSKSYFENVFRRYEGVNQGWLSDEQVDELLHRKIEYVILHEDLFPEKVSPFPVGWTLKQFLTHKRLQFIKQDGRVWAFKLLADRIEKKKSAADSWTTFGCARRWQAETCARTNVKLIRDSSPAHVSYAVLKAPGDCLSVPLQRVASAPHLRWMVRAKGNGALFAETTTSGKSTGCDHIDIEADEWEWFDIDVENLEGFAPISLKLEHAEGSVDCDQILLTAGEWILPSVGRTIILPAPCFFHAGYTSLADNTVVLEKGRDPVALIFYGQKLPLEKGRYRMELLFSADAPSGMLLGQFNIKRYDRDVILNWIPVVTGAQSFGEFVQTQNVPMYLEFRFLGKESLKIHSVKLTRLE